MAMVERRPSNADLPSCERHAELPSISPAGSDLIAAIRARTPARVLVGRCGPAYRTSTQLELRRDHAFAIDAVHAELNLEKHLGSETLQRWGLFEVSTQASSKSEYLLRPDLGRRLSDSAREQIVQKCPVSADLQIVIGDGLSVAALAQVPALLPLVDDGARRRGWTVGQVFAVRYCRVGILNDVGELLDPAVVVLLIGERPGLATAESLSAYLAYRPRRSHTDAERNLISNIHARGLTATEAAVRILKLADRMRQLKTSGTAVKI